MLPAIVCRALLHKSHTGQPADSHVTYVVAPRNRDQGLALRKSCSGFRLLILGELRFAPEPDTRAFALCLPSAVWLRIDDARIQPIPQAPSASTCHVVLWYRPSHRPRFEGSSRSATAASVFSRSRVERASRSSFVASSVSPVCKEARQRANAARSLFAPDCFSLNTRCAPASPPLVEHHDFARLCPRERSPLSFRVSVLCMTFVQQRFLRLRHSRIAAFPK